MFRIHCAFLAFGICVCLFIVLLRRKLINLSRVDASKR